jgi:hypothetical protein
MDNKMSHVFIFRCRNIKSAFKEASESSGKFSKQLHKLKANNKTT